MSRLMSAADAYLSFAARSSLLSFANDSRVAWIESVRGVPNVWAANASGGVPLRLTSFVDEDMELSGLRPAAGGGLVFGYAPLADTNPLHRTPTGRGAATFYVLPGEEPRVVANESLAGTTADGAAVLVVRKSAPSGEALWQLPLPTAHQSSREASLLFAVKQGTLGGFAWRPGGQVLAFANDRGSHGFVGLLARNRSAISWVAPSVDTDTAPTWSADGARLAWYRLSTPIGDAGYSPNDGDDGNRGPDYQVFVADVAWGSSGALAVGAATSVYEDRTYGIASFGYGRRPLAWAADGSLLFGTEAPSGWLHLARLDPREPAAGAAVLRGGACEDRAWHVHHGGEWALVSHNCDDLDGRGLEALGVSAKTLGQRRTLVAGGPHTVAGESHSAAGEAAGGVALAAGKVFWLQSSWDRPNGVWAAAFSDQVKKGEAAAEGGAAAAAARELTSDAVSSPGWAPQLVRPTLLTFPSSDGAFSLHAQLLVPREPSGAAVVYSHGGSERQAFAAFHFSAVYAQQYAVNQWLASRGIAVLSVNYRSGVGFGAAFRLCEGCMARGAAEYADVRAAAVQLAATNLTKVDPRRVGVWGISYGGLNALQAVTRDPQIFAAGVSGAGIFNWVSELRYYTDTGGSTYHLDVQPPLPHSWRGLTTGPLPHLAGPAWAASVHARLQLAHDSSPAAHASARTAALLLIQGDADEEVAFDESIGCVRALRNAGVEPETLVVPDESHGIGAYSNQLVAHEAMREFLARKLSLKAAAVVVEEDENEEVEADDVEEKPRPPPAKGTETAMAIEMEMAEAAPVGREVDVADCYNSTNRGGMRNYKQCDPRWGCFPYAGHAGASSCTATACAGEHGATENANNICASGCGITSSAMVLTYYGTYYGHTALTPADVAGWLVAHGYRDDRRANVSGATCDGVTHAAICAAGAALGSLTRCDQSSSFADLDRWLATGPVVAHVRRREGAPMGSCKFTNGGHYIVVVGPAAEEGSAYPISDPASCEAARTHGTPQEISVDCSLAGFVRLARPGWVGIA